MHKLEIMREKFRIKTKMSGKEKCYTVQRLKPEFNDPWPFCKKKQIGEYWEYCGRIESYHEFWNIIPYEFKTSEETEKYISDVIEVESENE